MRAVLPHAFAEWIRKLLVSVECNAGPDDPAGWPIGLRFRLSEEVPEQLFHSLRFELLVPVHDRHLAKIFFDVNDVMAQPGLEPAYLLAIGPAKFEGHDAERRLCDNLTALRTLVREMSLSSHPKTGVALDWRNGFRAIRYYHRKHPMRAAEIANPLFVPLPGARLSSDVIAALPSPERTRTDAEELEALIASADDAFSEPGPPRPMSRLARESYGYEVVIHDDGALELVRP